MTPAETDTASKFLLAPNLHMFKLKIPHMEVTGLGEGGRNFALVEGEGAQSLTASKGIHTVTW